MGSSYVAYRGDGFEANDTALEIWLRLLVEAIDARANLPDWLAAAREEWQLQATAGFGFGVIPGLDEFVTTAEQGELILELCEQAMQRLHSYGGSISKDELNQLNQATDSSYFTRDLSTEIFLETGEAFIKLLRDGIGPHASDTRP